MVAGLGWAGSVVLVRVLSPTAWGEYSLIFSIMGLVGSFADLQMGRVVIRDFRAAGDRLEDTLGSLLTLRLGVGAACYGAAVAVVWLGRYPSIVVAAMAVAALVLIIAAAGAAMDIFLTSQMWMRSVALASVLARASQLTLIVALAGAGYRGLIVFTLPAVLFEVVSLGWQIRTVRGAVRVRLHFDRSRWGTWFKEAAALAIGSALGSIYLRVDTVLLSKLADISAVGIYAIGAKFATLSGSLATAVCTALLVTLTKSWPGDPETFVAGFRRAFLLLWVVGMAVALEFGAFSGPVIGLLYGGHYVVGSGSAVGLVLAEVLTFFSALCFVTLVAMGKNLAYVLAAGLGVLVNVGINFVLIPMFSYNGASAATFITAALVLVILGSVLRSSGPPGKWLPWRGMAKVGVAGGAMAAVAFLLRGHAPWELVACLAGGVYLATLHVIRVDGPGGIRALAR